ncbi:MAG: ATP-dependent Clp protease ATP-binding subunit [Patescibacteria group bacterium]
MNMPQMPGANFTHKAQQAILFSQKIAGKQNKKKISPLHLLYSLLAQEDSTVSTLLEKKGVDTDQLKVRVENAMDKGEDIISPSEQSSPGRGQFFLSQSMAAVLKKASAEAKEMGDKYMSVEHLFLSLLQVDSNARNLIESADFLPAPKGGPEEPDEVDLSYDGLKESLTEIRGGEKITDPQPESKIQTIEKYTINLTDLAKEGETDPVIGRDEETRRLMQVLSRRTKNNPVLVGEAGVGKTAIVEGLAQRIAKKQVPESLKNKEVISLDLGSLVAGTRYRGEFENRMKALMKEIKKNKDKYVLFIDELHTLVGAGAAEGSIDASNLLKPDLARGKLRAIGATTQKEYQKYIEKDSALERRFQPIQVDEPTEEETVLILRGIKEKYELHHGVKIDDSALQAAAKLSNKHINDRQLPDKAIDLMDEAMSSLRLEVESQPKELEDLRKEIQTLEIEKQALKEGDDEKRKKAVERELADLKEKANDLSARWKTERETIDQIKELKEQIDRLEYKAEKAGQEAELEKVAKIKYGEIPTLKKKLQKEEKKLANIQKERPILKETVSEEDIADVISRWTGIPSNKLLEEEAKKLKRMEKIISKRVIGQDKAISAISNAIRRSRAGVAEEGKPLGSFLFLGPTGVGKTETARALAEFLFDDEDAMIRLDMSEYMEKHSVSKMIGAPPGYVGHDDSGQLTEQIRRKPYSVVLIDEIEKAHKEVFNMLLQVFEDGRLTDNKGREVSFKNAIIVMTSNAGSEYISESGSLGFSAKERKEQKREMVEESVMDELKKQFRPEFLNRIDEIVVFNHLEMDQVKEIVGLELDKVKERVMSNSGVKLEFKNSVKRHLAEKGFDRDMGARPLKRRIQKDILNPLAVKLISGNVLSGEKITVRIRDGEIDFETPQEVREGKPAQKEALVK